MLPTKITVTLDVTRPVTVTATVCRVLLKRSRRAVYLMAERRRIAAERALYGEPW